MFAFDGDELGQRLAELTQTRKVKCYLDPLVVLASSRLFVFAGGVCLVAGGSSVSFISERAAEPAEQASLASLAVWRRLKTLPLWLILRCSELERTFGHAHLTFESQWRISAAPVSHCVVRLSLLPSSLATPAKRLARRPSLLGFIVVASFASVPCGQQRHKLASWPTERCQPRRW